MSITNPNRVRRTLPCAGSWAWTMILLRGKPHAEQELAWGMCFLDIVFPLLQAGEGNKYSPYFLPAPNYYSLVTFREHILWPGRTSRSEIVREQNAKHM